MRQFDLTFVLLITSSIFGIVWSVDDWWEYGHFYQIYPRSFKDSDGDGIGDLNGITSKLPYLKTLNISGVWLSPIFKSPMKDVGYDISDFTEIHYEFGTMADFERLLKKCKEIGIKLILDFVPNHTSDQHDWFIKSANPDHPEHSKYKDYYVWHPGKLLANGTRVPPSNWQAVFGGSMWSWSPTRNAYYLHQFLVEQPDLNFRNENVIEEMNNVLRFWLRKGVSGFRIDAIPHLFEVEENAQGLYDDEYLSDWCKHMAFRFCPINHTQTQYLDETYNLLYQWRNLLNETEFNDHTRILMTELYGSLSQITRCYGKVQNGQVVEYGAQIPFNFHFMSLQRWTDAIQISSMITSWINEMPKGNGIQPNWLLGNHDRGRVASFYGPERTDIFNMLLKTLPGITVTYNGEEIGMTDVLEAASMNLRFVGRSPIQWDNTTSAGFSSNPNTWLPVAKNYTSNNVELQQSQQNSHLKVFQQLVSMRQHPTFKYGTLTMNTANNGAVFMYKREIIDDPNADIFVVLLNLSNGLQIHDLDIGSIFDDVPKKMKAVISSKSNKLGQVFDIKSIKMEAFEGTVLLGTRKNQL